MRLGETCVVAATFQEARHFTPSTTQRYRDLVERTGFVCALGEGLPVEPLPGLRGADLGPDDPVRGEWDVVVLGPHFTAALLARDLGDAGPDIERIFEYALTYDRATVVRAAHALLSRVAPRVRRRPSPLARTARPPPAASDARRWRRQLDDDALLRSALLGATTSGVTIADMRRPDPPLVFVNAAFETARRLPADRGARPQLPLPAEHRTPTRRPSRGSARPRRGEECREPVLNYRGPDRTPWWNEMHLSPVTDAAGTRRAVHRRPARRHRAGRGRARPAARSATATARTWPGSRSWPTPTR